MNKIASNTAQKTLKVRQEHSKTNSKKIKINFSQKKNFVVGDPKKKDSKEIIKLPFYDLKTSENRSSLSKSSIKSSIRSIIKIRYFSTLMSTIFPRLQ